MNVGDKKDVSINNSAEEYNVPSWYGEAAQSIAPVGFMMAGFMLVYSIWFGFAWGLAGWLAFALSALLSIFIAVKSIKNYKHSRKYAVNKSESGKKIGKAMAKLSVVTYGILWIIVIALFFTGHYKYVFPSITLIIALHFFPQARIFNRKVDYYIAPFPLVSSIIAFMFASQPDATWLEVYAIAGVGGVIATAAYGIYMLVSYKTITRAAGIVSA